MSKLREFLEEGYRCIEFERVVGNDEREKLRQDYEEALAELNKFDDAVYEAAVLLGEAVRRPLWGSLQGDWPERADAWARKWNLTGVIKRRADAIQA
jgi:hypothetical protein